MPSTSAITGLPQSFIARPCPDGSVVITTEGHEGQIEVEICADQDQCSRWVAADTHEPLTPGIAQDTEVLPLEEGEVAVPVMIDVPHSNPVVAALIAQRMLVAGMEAERGENRLVESWWFLDRAHKSVDGNDCYHGEVVFTHEDMSTFQA